MQLTQKLLIEKGLNLKEERAEDSYLPQPREFQKDDSSLLPVDTPIENVAKAHEEFFGKKNKNNTSIFWIIGIALVVFIAIVLIVNSLANQSV
jgi:hypothetical protein